MARQVINTNPPVGDPAPTAFDKCNLNFAELYLIALGALQRTGGTLTGPVWMSGASGAIWWQDRTGDRDFAAYSSGNVWRLAGGLRGQPTADLLTLDASGNVFVQGRVVKQGLLNAENFRIQNVGSEQGIGGDYGSWSGNRYPALQIDAQNNNYAYMPVRVTKWGVKHLWGVDVNAGGDSGGAQTVVDFHFAAGQNRHRFIDNGSMIIAGTLTQNSDYRIKAEDTPISPESAAAAMRTVKPIEYTDITDNGKRPRRAGVFAHEFQEAFPLLVHGSKDETEEVSVLEGDTTPYEPGTEPDGYVPPFSVNKVVPKLQNVNYAGATPYLMAAWQEHDNRIERLETALDSAQAALTAALDRIAVLESVA